MTKTKSLNGISRIEYYDSGAVKEYSLTEENIIETSCGKLIPKYSDEEIRRKFTSSVSFYEDQNIKRISVEKQDLIITPIGTYPAESVILYPNGALKRFFPLNGKISGYWTVEDETNLCETLQFHLSVGAFRAKIIGISFYESGALKSLTLWPGEEIVINTNVGLFPVQIGFALYESGAVKSVEPAYPIPIITPIGNVTVYDENAIGIESDDNSLKFDEEGKIIGFKTSFCKIAVFQSDGTRKIMEPIMAASMTDDDAFVKIPLSVNIDGDRIFIDNGEIIEEFSSSADRFVIQQDHESTGTTKQSGCSGADCSSCTSCKS